MISNVRAQGAAVRIAVAALVIGAWFVLSSASGNAEDTRIPFPRPSSHEGRWLEYHGKSVEAAGNSPGSPGTACLTCHTRTDCFGCHSTKLPKDHTAYWRTRGHGLMVAGNRERCLTCHRQEYCIRCHNETAPRSHTGSWAQRHCAWCHYRGSYVPPDNCNVCHRVARHLSAPHAVNPSLNCALCHT